MSDGSISSLFRMRGFLPLWGSQCLASFNDHCFKILTSMLAVEMARQQGHSGGDLPLVAAAFVTPYLLFSALAGRLADSVSKPRLLQTMKAVEVLAMLAGLAALVVGSVPAMIAVVFLMGTHSTFFGPARAGFMAEMVGTRALAGANGVLDMGSYLSIVLGTMGGTLLFGWFKDSLWHAGALLVATAMVGFLISLRLPKEEPVALQGARVRFLDGFQRLRQDAKLARTVAAIAGFWFLGALMQMLVLLLAKETLHLEETRTGLLLAALAVGIGVGSLIAGRLSAQSIELGLLPMGGAGIMIGLAMLARAHSFESALPALLGLGISGGFWIVPLDAYLQFRTQANERGRVLGASAIVNTIGTLAAPAILWAAGKVGLSNTALLWFAAAVALIGTAVALVLNIRPLARFLTLRLVRVFYRIRLEGASNIPMNGGALLIANHVTYVDAFMISACTPRFVRFLVVEKYYNQFKPLMQFLRAIPVKHGRPRDIVQMIAKARAELKAGHVVCIFPEGNLTHTGNIMEFQRGMEKILEGLDVPVIPIHMHGLWGSVFSYEGGTAFRKLPKQLRYPVRITVGNALPKGVTAPEAREAVTVLGARAAEIESRTLPQLQQAFVKSAKRYPSRQALADSTGRSLNYREALIASRLLANRLRAVDGHMVGIVMPASVGGALANIATLMANKIPVNLNFTIGKDAMESAIAQCGIQRILTSKAFLSKAKLEEREGMVFVEDLLGSFSKWEKLRAAAWSLLPEALLRRMVCNASGSAQEMATVLFSSGSSGKPKGVMLSHANIMANIQACSELIPLSDSDRVAGVLPFFHSFGFNFTLWFPLVRGIGSIYHPNPIDGKGVGALVAAHRATILLATPTFCGFYVRGVEPEQFRTLKLMLVGAEKLRPSIAEAFHAKFGITPLEGYGATEMAPVIAVNTPDVDCGGYTQRASIPGSVGRALPGVAIRTVDPETKAPLPAGSEGLLLVNGPNRMLGYLGDIERTEQAFVDGWYNTGDIGRIDDEGFVTLTGRLSRFSKIGGEMVPHGRVEEALEACLSDGARCCLVAIADEERGERLVALHTDGLQTAAQLASKLSRSGLPNLWLPRRDAIVFVPELPTLGSGKLDLQRAKRMAMESQAEPVGVTAG